MLNRWPPENDGLLSPATAAVQQEIMKIPDHIPGSLRSVHRVKQCRETPIRILPAGVQLDGTLETLDGFACPSKSSVGAAEIEVVIRTIRFSYDRSLQQGDGIGKPPFAVARSRHRRHHLRVLGKPLLDGGE